MESPTPTPGTLSNIHFYLICTLNVTFNMMLCFIMTILIMFLIIIVSYELFKKLASVLNSFLSVSNFEINVLNSQE